jgi:DNA integrity scanning protein DisA with diadenylate cyclase activity
MNLLKIREYEYCLVQEHRRGCFFIETGLMQHMINLNVLDGIELRRVLGYSRNVDIFSNVVSTKQY